jgi:hypothetical protein
MVESCFLEPRDLPQVCGDDVVVFGLELDSGRLRHDDQ